jgi:hypothetical protein
MKNILKWFFVVGAVLSGLILTGALFFNRMWVRQYATSFGHGGMMYGGRHSAFGVTSSYGGIILGIILLLVVIAGIFLAIRSMTESDPASGVQRDLYETCPACTVNLEQNWKYCPSCGFDLS